MNLRCSFLLLFACLPLAGHATVTPYPAFPGRPTSERYTVVADGQPIWTESYRTHFELDRLPSWFTSAPETRVQQEVHLAAFACTGPVSLDITVNVPPRSVVVHPVSRGIVPLVRGNRITFSITGPDNLYLTIDDLPALCLFANPLETEELSAVQTGVRYFGPGVHEAGLITLKSNETLYLAPGALVYGGIRLAPQARRVRILGRGTLDGNLSVEDMVLLEGGQGIEVRGVTIRAGSGWTNTLVACRDVTYRDVKVISFCPSGDGINPVGSDNVTIDRCFLRCTDDCVAVKAPDPAKGVQNILVTRSTLVGFAFADGVTIGFETNGADISKVRVRDCDIVMARGGSRVDGHSAFSIICDGPSLISDIAYENVRVEEDVLKLFELHITDGTKYDVNPPGRIRGVTLSNIRWASARPIILRGFSEQNRVEDVTFVNCRIGDQPLTEARSDLFQINPHVRGVEFR
ncbi:MAG: glycosyl hydrolase family 28 protein [Opitutaceae bacterium]